MSAPGTADMSVSHTGLWHYEGPIESRGPGHEWRIGDADDDMVADCDSEEVALRIVESHNARYLLNHRDKWVR